MHRKKSNPPEGENHGNQTVFVGVLSYDRILTGTAYSEAATQVQNEIIEALQELIGKEKVSTVSMTPIPAFPRGKLMVRGAIRDTFHYLPFLNIPVIKHLIYAMKLWIFLVSRKPSNVIIYNSYFFQNIAVLFYKALHCRAKVAILVQDVLPAVTCWKEIQRSIDRFSLRFVSKFDLVLPISQAIIHDFKIPTKYILIQGGITKKILEIFSSDIFSGNKKCRAVFAGGLEPHNGIDLLLREWVNQNIDIELHVFGKGSMESFVEHASRENKNIFFHGFKPHAEVQRFISESIFVFVLRYSIGLEAKYFFPSKFWESMASDNLVICNKFENFPEDLSKFCLILKNDLKDLNAILDIGAKEDGNKIVTDRKKHMVENHTWRMHVKKILESLSN